MEANKLTSMPAFIFAGAHESQTRPFFRPSRRVHHANLEPRGSSSCKAKYFDQKLFEQLRSGTEAERLGGGGGGDGATAIATFCSRRLK